MSDAAIGVILGIAIGCNLANKSDKENEEECYAGFVIEELKRGRALWKRKYPREFWHARKGHGNSYAGVEHYGLSILQDPHYTPHGRFAYIPNHLRCSPYDGYRKLWKALERYKDTQVQRDAMRRLRAAYAIPTVETTPGLYIKVFNDLAVVLFNGILLNRVYVQWADLIPRRCIGETHSLLLSSRHGVSRVAVYLDKTMFVVSHKSRVWGTLIHEMVHAFMFMVAITNRYNTGHGPQFNDAVEGCIRVLRLPGLELRHAVNL